MIRLNICLGSVSGSPNQHSSSPSGRGSSAEPVNVTMTSESGASSPSQVKKKVHGMHLIQLLCIQALNFKLTS
jgi:hypothetical protein